MRTAAVFFAVLALAAPALACDASDAKVTVSRWSDEAGAHVAFSVVGELVNNSSDAVGIHVRFVGYDKDGKMVDVKETWPASVRNIPARSRAPFKTTAFHYNPAIKTLTAEVIEVRRWP